MSEYPWIPPTVTIIISVIAAWLKLNQVEKTFNSKMDKYIALAEAAAEARGVLKEGARRDALDAGRATGRAEGRAEGRATDETGGLAP